jgi:hypothetical protein
MLVRLLYASRAADDVGNDAVAAILEVSRRNNQAAGVTGVLCFCSNAHVFLQVFEGGRQAVSTIYNRVAADPRHRDVVLLDYDEIAERSFSGWSMGQVNMSRLNPSLLLKYSDRALLDPYAVGGKASLALLNELVATASVSIRS